MITTRPLFPDALTASCIELNLQSLNRLLLVSVSARASGLLRNARGCDGRTTNPTLRASLIDACKRLRESDWQTTLVFASVSAEASVRGVGTCPPAHGDTEQSGAGSGQYEARSTCAAASAGASSATSNAAVTQAQIRLPRRSPDRMENGL